MTYEDIQEKINKVKWDFNDSNTSWGIHSIHPYPAKFIPEIPNKLIKLFHKSDNHCVFDPFCGSGTTLVEAINTGFDAVGVDLNPLACLISRVKTTPLKKDLISISKKIIRFSKRRVKNNEYQIPNIPRLDHWFKKDIQIVLAALTQEITHIEDTHIKEALEVALSSIIVQVSNQESDTRYAAIDKSVTKEDVFLKFNQATTNIFRAISNHYNNMMRYSGKKLGTAEVINNDILEVKKSDLPDNIGTVITSPPYPNAYEYWLYHKYRMYWLGMDPISVRENEIGARPHFHGSNPQDEKDFENQMSCLFKLLSNTLDSESVACFLVGNSIIRGRKIDNVELLSRAANNRGFILKGVISRNLPKNRRAFNPNHSNRKKEYLTIFKLEG